MNSRWNDVRWQKSTVWSLSHNQHPNCTIILPEINPFTIGRLLYMMQLQTAYADELFQVNAFDQPGVEEGKKATSLMGRTGDDQMRNQLSATVDSTSDYII